MITTWFVSLDVESHRGCHTFKLFSKLFKGRFHTCRFIYSWPRERKTCCGILVLVLFTFTFFKQASNDWTAFLIGTLCHQQEIKFSTFVLWCGSLRSFVSQSGKSRQWKKNVKNLIVIIIRPPVDYIITLYSDNWGLITVHHQDTLRCEWSSDKNKNSSFNSVWQGGKKKRI